MLNYLWEVKLIENYWNFWVGGLAIAGIAILTPLLSGKFLGVTRGYSSLCSIFSKEKYFHLKEFGGGWGFRTLFVIGLLVGGFLAAIKTGDWKYSFNYGMFDNIYSSSILIKSFVLFIGGAFWGFGARLAKGCTSGNSISGLAKGSLAALVSTLCFLVAGISITYLINYLAGTL